MIGIYILKSILDMMKGGRTSTPAPPNIPTRDITGTPKKVLEQQYSKPRFTTPTTVNRKIDPVNIYKPPSLTPLRPPTNGKKLTISPDLKWR